MEGLRPRAAHVRLSLSADGQRLRVVGRKGQLSGDLYAAFVQRKSEIMALLHSWYVGACFACRGTLCWFSWDDCLICARCHPPADPSLVKAWISVIHDAAH